MTPRSAAREHERLAHRARRLEAVMAALQDRAAVRGRAAPAPLHQAIEGFRGELRRVRGRLADHHHNHHNHHGGAYS
jgi:hypothetical protein